MNQDDLLRIASDEIEIEKDIPLPPERRSRYLWNAMQVAKRRLLLLKAIQHIWRHLHNAGIRDALKLFQGRTEAANSFLNVLPAILRGCHSVLMIKARSISLADSRNSRSKSRKTSTCSVSELGWFEHAS
jgi:hypothetical protein